MALRVWLWNSFFIFLPVSSSIFTLFSLFIHTNILCSFQYIFISLPLQDDIQIAQKIGEVQHFLSMFLNFIIVCSLCNNAPLEGTLEGAKETVVVASTSSARNVPSEASLARQILQGTQTSVIKEKCSNVIS